MDNCSNFGDLTLSINVPTTYSCGASSPVAVTLTIQDAAGNTDDCMADLYIVDNEPPIAVCPSSYTVTLGSNGEVDLNALPATMNIVDNSIDNCNTMPSTLMVYPDALSVPSGQDSTKLTCANIGVNTVSYTVEDLSGNTATCTNMITVQEGTPPQIVCPAAMTVDCMDGTTIADTGNATASDNCDVNTITHTDVCLLYTSPSPRDATLSRMPSSA